MNSQLLHLFSLFHGLDPFNDRLTELLHAFLLSVNPYLRRNPVLLEMIILEFNRISIDQLAGWLSHVSGEWKKIRGRSGWGVGLVLISSEKRQMQDHQLVMTEWKITKMRDNPKTMIVFLFNTFENSCEVFISTGYGSLLSDKKVARAIEQAFDSFSASGLIEQF